MERPVVSVSDGEIKGIVRESVLGKKWLSPAYRTRNHRSVPYGLRNHNHRKNGRDFDASKRTDDMAMQYESEGPKPWKVISDEDYLYLNVYTNSISRKRPVMFFIHGGAFVEGSGNRWIYGEDYFVSMNMILVSVNYRFGPFGFLNLGYEVASGNQGLRDILLALKWVQCNIEAFGGDPNNVTIFGNSSGSVICHLLTLIPAARGLFHKAILQSGLGFKYKNLLKESNFKNGCKIASFLGCKSEDPSEIIEFIRTVPGKKLVSVQNHLLSK